VAPELTNNDWVFLVADFANELMAQDLVAMLNHQGLPIPARKVKKNGSYQVIAKTQKMPNRLHIASKWILSWMLSYYSLG
jgi:hypothetical protein